VPIAALDAVHFDEVREGVAQESRKLAIRGVGPHSADEFFLAQLVRR